MILKTNEWPMFMNTDSYVDMIKFGKKGKNYWPNWIDSSNNYLLYNEWMIDCEQW